MSELLHRELIADKAIVRDQLNVAHSVDRSFELPKELYVGTVGLYLGFLAVMGLGLANPGLILPMAIFVLFVVAGFGLPTIWTTMAPKEGQKALTMGQLRQRGIMTHTGRLSAKDATAQVLMLPILIFFWGVAMVVIAATV